jgi:lipopolysaccharide transport system ATP-binding protein
VEQFIDTPVKRYSSGMYVRLAFAVAAHLEPEILIVDEVLAVGDTTFQQKCIGKMDEVSRTQGRTVLFVSHNLAAVRQLTTRCLYLLRGEITEAGATRTVLDRYARAGENNQSAAQGRFATVAEARLVDEHGLQLTGHHGEPVVWVEVIVATTGNPHSSLECYLTDLEGTRLGLYSPGHFAGWRLPSAAGRYRCRLPISLPRLATGNFGIDVSTTVHGSGHDHYVANAIVFGSSSQFSFPTKWELRKEYASGYFILDAGEPQVARVD